MEELKSIATWLAGVGGTTVIVVVCILVYKGKLRLEREFLDLFKRLVEVESEKVFWRNMAIKNNQIAEGGQQLARDGVLVAKQAVDKDNNDTP